MSLQLLRGAASWLGREAQAAAGHGSHRLCELWVGGAAVVWAAAGF